jgi:trehalose-6-phosphate synthase
LVQIAVPTRTEIEEYKKLSSQTNELVGRINGKFGTVDHSPIMFINQSLAFEELVALYTVAVSWLIKKESSPSDYRIYLGYCNRIFGTRRNEFGIL